MKSIRSALTLLLTFALLFATGCLELVGQRITLRHDAAKDELHLMVHYDGLHDSGNNEHGNGAQQVAAAVQNGEFMLLDWPFHVQPLKFKEIASDPGVPDAMRDFLKLAADSVQVQAIGFHRDPDGRIGGSQLITIKGAKAFIKAANDAISAGILTMQDEPDPKLARTAKLIKAAAEKKHQWLSLDGNALKVSVPVHPREWAITKADGLLKLVDQIARLGASDNPNRESDQKEAALVVAAITSAPVEYSDADGLVTLRIGDTKSSSTLRIEMPKEYKPNLVEAVTKAAPADLDDLMAKLMIGEKVEKQESEAALVKEVMTWGPPEEKVRGLMKLAKGNDAKLAAKAVKKLEEFAEKWNETEGHPKAPAAAADTEKYIEDWTAWYYAALRFPSGAIPDLEP